MVKSLFFIFSAIFGNTSMDEFVSIKTLNIFSGARGTGSGVMLDKTHVLTAAHVVRSGEGTLRFVECLNAPEPTALVVVDMYIDDERDLALITTEGSCPGTRIQKIASEDPGYGEPLWAIGCPAGTCGMVTRGVMSMYQIRNEVKILYSDTKIWFGNSGGPLFNNNKEVVGICSRIWSVDRIDMEDGKMDVMSQNYSIWIPASEINEFLKEAKEAEKK